MNSRRERSSADRYRAAAQQRVDEPVLAAGLFHRRRARTRTSAFPRTFVVAVTPTRLHAFAASDARDLGEEVAVWDRHAIQVRAQDTSMNTRVTIAEPGASGKVVCRTGRDERSRSVVRYMEDPHVVAA